MGRRGGRPRRWRFDAGRHPMLDGVEALWDRGRGCCGNRRRGNPQLGQLLARGRARGLRGDFPELGAGTFCANTPGPAGRPLLVSFESRARGGEGAEPDPQIRGSSALRHQLSGRDAAKARRGTSGVRLARTSFFKTTDRRTVSVGRSRAAAHRGSGGRRKNREALETGGQGEPGLQPGQGGRPLDADFWAPRPPRRDNGAGYSCG